MATTAKSRWADENDEAVKVVAQRKREKEERKRIKAERLRKAAHTDSTLPVQQAPEPVSVNGESERPAKRRRTSNDPELHQDPDPAPDADPKLLRFPAAQFGPCRDVELYELLNNIEEGSYGMVSRARAKGTGEIVALKRLKMEHANDGFPVTGLREIQTLMASHHHNIVKLREVVMGSSLRE